MLTAFMVALGIAATSVVIGVLRWHIWLKWWEVLLMLPVPVAICMLAWVMGFVGASSDTEYVSSWVSKVRYDEAWNELQARTRTVMVGKTAVVQTYYVTVEHPPVWRAFGAHGGVQSISQRRYNDIVQSWGVKPVFIELNRHSHTRDGDRYEATFPGDDEHLLPFTSTESYENRVRSAPSLFRYDVEVTEPVARYPGWVHEGVPSVIGEASPAERHAFDVMNARIGAAQGVRVWAVVWKKAPLSRAWQQEAAWIGGHRNEIVVVVSVDDDRHVQWCRVFGWTHSETLKVQIRQQVTAQDKLDLVPVAAWVRENLPGRYERRNFAEFSYLPVPVPWWVYLVGALLAIGANAGLMVWLVKNDHHDASMSVRRSWLSPFDELMHEIARSTEWTYSGRRRH